MPAIAAKELVHKLRSHGIKVYLDATGTVHFSKEFRDVAPDLKLLVVQHGYVIRDLLRGEAERRAQREKINPQPHNNTPTDEL